MVGYSFLKSAIWERVIGGTKRLKKLSPNFFGATKNYSPSFGRKELSEIISNVRKELQGHPSQTVFFETALTDRNIKVKFALKLVLEC